MTNKIYSYLIAVAWIATVAVTGATLTNLGVSQLDILNLPTMWIDGWLISVVWTVIYLCLTIYIIVLIATDTLTNTTIALVIANGILNVLWCGVFFGMGSLLGGQVIIIANTVLAILLAVDAYNKRPIYGYISIYPLWLIIATLLNTAVWILN